MKIMASLIALCLATPVLASSGREDVSAYQALAAQDVRLLNVGFRLAQANAEFCTETTRNPGFILQDIKQYPDQDVAGKAFLFRRPISIAALAKDGPAILAGIKMGDGLVTINGTSIAYPKESEKSRPSVKRLLAANDMIDRVLKAGGPLKLMMQTERGTQEFTINPQAICTSRFYVDPKSQKDAGADGEQVRITSGFMEYLADDRELAALVAHEISHNILGHRPYLKGIKQGKTQAIRATEIEADRLSVWLMANAGYDPHAAIRFWQHYGPKQDLGILNAPTHPSWRKRIQLLETEIAEMEKSAVQNGKKRPPLLHKSNHQQ
jgi:beta-barrel assembly-enhancing protease